MRFHRLGVATLLALWGTSPLMAQRPIPKEIEPTEPRVTRPEVRIPPPPVPDGSPVPSERPSTVPDQNPLPHVPGIGGDAPPGPPAPQWMINPKADFAFIPKWAQNRNASIAEIDLSAPMQIPLGYGDWLPALKINPVIAQRFWGGPNTAGIVPPPDVPGALYEFYADFRVRSRLAEWFFLDLRVTPGFYTDMHNTTTDSWMPRGHAVGIFAFSETFQFLAGIAATNRVLSQLVPVGGFIYTPDEDTEIRLVFPIPRLAVCIDQRADTKYWLHLSGEWGGGAWGVQRQNGLADKLDYSDARIFAGIESQTNQIVNWHVEVGFVFWRELSYRSQAPKRFDLGDSVVMRFGISY